MLPSRWSLNIHGEGKAASAAPCGRSGRRVAASAAGEHPGPRQCGTPAPLQGPPGHRCCQGVRVDPSPSPAWFAGLGPDPAPWQAAISGWSRGTPGAARRDAAAAVRSNRTGGTLLAVIAPGHLRRGWMGLSPSPWVPSCSQAGWIGDAPSPLPTAGSLLAVRGCLAPLGCWGRAGGVRPVTRQHGRSCTPSLAAPCAGGWGERPWWVAPPKFHGFLSALGDHPSPRGCSGWERGDTAHAPAQLCWP